MAERINGVLEDIAAEIGYTATAALVDWFGGQLIHIPNVPDASHQVARVIGLSAFSRICSVWGGTPLYVPSEHWREAARRDRMIAGMYQQGIGTRDIARMTSLTERQVQNIRRQLEESGLVPMVLKTPQTR